MTKYRSQSKHRLAKVVIAFQPVSFGKSRKGVEPGCVALFGLGDPRVHLFDCFDGACWVHWRAEPELQLGRMIELAKALIRDCGISEAEVTRAFRQCPEFRTYHDQQQ